MSHINFSRNILGSIMDPASLAMGSKIRFAGQTGRKFNLKPLSHHNFVGEKFQVVLEILRLGSKRLV